MMQRIVECAQALIEERYLPSIREAMLGEVRRQTTALLSWEPSWI
jgi:hypothetical protein